MAAETSRFSARCRNFSPPSLRITSLSCIQRYSSGVQRTPLEDAVARASVLWAFRKSSSQPRSSSFGIFTASASFLFQNAAAASYCFSDIVSIVLLLSLPNFIFYDTASHKKRCTEPAVPAGCCRRALSSPFSGFLSVFSSPSVLFLSPSGSGASARSPRHRASRGCLRYTPSRSRP